MKESANTKKQYAIAQIVVLVKKITGSNVAPQYDKVALAQTETGTWVYDISKAKKILGWEPKYTLEQGLRKDVEWFKDNLNFYA